MRPEWGVLGRSSITVAPMGPRSNDPTVPVDNRRGRTFGGRRGQTMLAKPV
jgi:hypothetical protein